MNEFEWRRQLRGLQQPIAPPHDLWSRIESTLDVHQPAASSPGRRLQLPAWLLVAGFAGITLLAVSLGWQQQQHPRQTPVAEAARTQSAPWKPQDPRLAGAAIELDAARMELRQALRQSPDSDGLQRLLLHTEQQQSRLRHLEQAS